MKIGFAVFCFIHAMAHAAGTVTMLGVTDADISPTFLLTGFAADHWVMRVFALLWLLPLAGFVAAGIGVLQGASWTVPVLIAATAVSGLLTIIWAKATPFGLLANVIVLVVLVVPALADRVLPG